MGEKKRNSVFKDDPGDMFLYASIIRFAEDSGRDWLANVAGFTENEKGVFGKTLFLHRKDGSDVPTCVIVIEWKDYMWTASVKPLVKGFRKWRQGKSSRIRLAPESYNAAIRKARDVHGAIRNSFEKEETYD